MQRILIVEGNENAAKYLAGILQKEKYFVKIANSGAQAFEDISSYQFNLIILDLILPDTSGTKVLTSIRKNFNQEHLPIVVISNIRDEDKIAELLTLGANDFIAQPFSEPILILKLKNHLLLQERNDELNKNNEVLKDVIENIPILSIIVNEDVRILNTNKLFSEQFGLDYNNVSKELVGNVVRCVNAINNDGQCGQTAECKNCIVRNSVNETLRTGKNIFKRNGLFKLKINDKENEFTLQLSTTQILYRNSPSVLLSINDVTKEKKYLNELKKAKDKYQSQAKDLLQKEQVLIEQKRQLQELNATKDRFLSIITHDLKNPFFALLGLSEALYKNGSVMSEQKREKFISFIYDSVRNTYELLEDLLSWAHSQSGKMTITQKKVNLKPLIFEIISLLQTLIDNKKLTLENLITEDIFLYTDEDMLHSVIRNLFTNAIKYCKTEGTITIQVQKKNDLAEICVSDTGVGMTEETINTLFKTGETQSRLGTYNEKGTGLGLILCKEFVEKLGGTIYVESELGKGSQFRFTMPLWNENFVKSN